MLHALQRIHARAQHLIAITRSCLAYTCLLYVVQRKQLVEMRSRLSELESEVLATAHKLSQANAHTENEVSAARFEAERRWEEESQHCCNF